MTKNKKKSIINLLIVAITITLIVGILLITINVIRPESKNKKTPQKEGTQDNISNTPMQNNITTPEEVIELLNKTQMQEGYSFVHKQTEQNKITINQVNTQTGEVLKEYIYDIDTHTMMIGTYNTGGSSSNVE